MKVCIAVDKLGSAIHTLALSIQKHNPHLNIQVVDVHPKRPSETQLRNAHRAINDASIVHVMYWRSGETIKEMIGKKLKILSHFNPYDLDKLDWQDYKKITVCNQTMHTELPRAKHIPLGVDVEFFKYNNDYTKDFNVLMVAGRIESSKGIKEVAEACNELNIPFNLVGRISDRAYFNSLPDSVLFHENVTNEQLRDLYYQSALHVCNSKDNFESGTMPILEAMASGVPVLSRIVGHVPDLYNGKNMFLLTEAKENVEHIKKKLQDIQLNQHLREKTRKNAWQTVKNISDKHMAWRYGKLYIESFGQPTVSIIVPTFNRPKVLAKCLEHINNQTYTACEVIVVDSGSQPVRELVMEFKRITKYPVKYIHFDAMGEYTLPKARNMAVMEAQGQYLCFCDERIGMDKNAIQTFVNHRDHSMWLYGVKDNKPKSFVENFSFVKKSTLIKIGMFNERINVYGGQSQEIRQRADYNTIGLVLVHDAHAKGLSKSSNQNKKAHIAEAKFRLFKMYS